MKTLTEALHAGVKMGFTQAREHPEQTLDEFMQQITDFSGQLHALPDWKLRLLAGKGTFLDSTRLRFEKR